MMAVDVWPLADTDSVPGAPGVSGADLFKYLPVLAKLLEAFSAGTGSFSTWTPKGKRWVIVTDQPPGNAP